MTTIDPGIDSMPIPATINLPDTADDAVTLLDQAGQLATAVGWARAALVYALVGPSGTNGRPKTDEKSSVMRIDQLAERKLHGLGTKDSIRKYRDAWQATGRDAQLGQPGALMT